MTHRSARAARAARAARVAGAAIALRALVVAVAAFAVMLAATPAFAQIAAALGKPLPSPDLPVGTVSVRIVAGSASSPVVGTDVTLVVNDAPRVARTDSAGRATFAGLAVGATVVAKVVDEDKAEHASESFQVPDSGGTRLLISTKPWQPGAGGAPFAGGGGGMPNPRQMSGEPRPDQADPPGTITVRVTYDDFKDTPEGVAVALVGYGADDTTTYRVLDTDKAGRVRFTDLDRGGGTAYYAMTLLPRNGGFDRLASTYIVLDSQMGVSLLLSAEKRDSTAAAVDDFGKLEPQVATPAGKVRAVLLGKADLNAKVALIDAATKKVLGETRPSVAEPDPTRIRGGSHFQADPKLAAGTLDVSVVGSNGQSVEPIEGVEIRVIPASSSDASTAQASVTGADGSVRIVRQASEPQKAVFTINGKPFVSQPFDLSKSGGKLTVRALWETTGQPEAMFDLAGAQGKVVYAECTCQGERYRSLPFQLMDATGSKVTVYAYPRIRFQFELQAEIEDELLAVGGMLDVANNSWAPYRAGPDGFLLAMPRGFKGLRVADSDQSEVAVVQGEGFRIIRPIPPGGRKFHGGFSLPVENGRTTWALDLPNGADQSRLIIRQTPGMVVHAPPKAPTETRTVPQGTFVLIDPITIKDGQSMVLSLEGLPSQPSWRRWLPRLLGVLVIAIMLAGVYFALARKPAPAETAMAARTARRQRLLDELVELERTGSNPRRRDQLLGELEDLWS